MRIAGPRWMLCVALSSIATGALATSATAATSGGAVGMYVVDGVRDSLDRSAVAATGAAIVEVGHANVVVTASASDVRRLRKLGRYRVTRYVARRTRAPKLDGGLVAGAGFPAVDSGYHTYQEVVDETAMIAETYPSIVNRIELGTTSENRTIYALKISDNAATDEAEPEALFTFNQHAHEHLTVEMAMYLLNELTSKYATDARIKNVVDTREIWIIPTVNPDGAEFDILTGSYADWRKNRQPNARSDKIGTDLNRNWGFQWGCCTGASFGASSPDPGSETFRGETAFSAPETRAVRDFVQSRRIRGVQNIKTAIDFHAYMELVLWPYGYTADDTNATMTADQHNTFATLGKSMADTNRYTPQQGGDLYIADGAIDDWLWGAEGVFAYTFEMYPKTKDPGFYPPDEVIPAETSRNLKAVLLLLEISDCPYRAIGKEKEYCPSRSLSPTRI